jgi:hypothetical protein
MSPYRATLPLVRKTFMTCTIRTLDKPDPGLERVAKASGFSLHAGGAAKVTKRISGSGYADTFLQVYDIHP